MAKIKIGKINSDHIVEVSGKNIEIGKKKTCPECNKESKAFIDEICIVCYKKIND